MPKYVDSMYSFAIIKLNLIFKKGVLKNERKKIGASQMDGNGNGGYNVVFRCSGCSVSGRLDELSAGDLMFKTDGFVSFDKDKKYVGTATPHDGLDGTDETF